MLLYALYTPEKIDSWNKEKVYAFCSVERYIECLRQNKQLKPLTHAEAMRENSLAYLYVGEKGDENGFADDFIHTRESAIRNKWDGKLVEVQLVERCDEENYHINGKYA